MLVSPEVKYLAVIQDGQQDYRPLQSHIGTYLVCLEKPGPVHQVTRWRLSDPTQITQSYFVLLSATVAAASGRCPAHLPARY
jgi:hypothetical protein